MELLSLKIFHLSDNIGVFEPNTIERLKKVFDFFDYHSKQRIRNSAFICPYSVFFKSRRQIPAPLIAKIGKVSISAFL